MEFSPFLKTATFVAFDCETTGFSPLTGRVVEIAGVKFSLADASLETFQSLINPSIHIPENVTRVHGITNDMVAKAPPAEIVVKDFVKFCGSAILIAHFAEFDMSFLNVELTRMRHQNIRNTVIDSRKIPQKYLPGLQSYSLLNISRNLLLADNQEHRALPDAELVHKIFRAMANHLSSTPSENDLDEMFGIDKSQVWRNELTNLPMAFADISKAIELRLPIEICYQQPGRQMHSRVIEPLAAFGRLDAVYLCAYCPEIAAERTFRLDRVRSFRICHSVLADK